MSRFVIFGVVFLMVSCAVEAADPTLDHALREVRGQDLRSHVAALASDRFRGRGTPSKGLHLAARYLASQFESMGLIPAYGESFLQACSVKALVASTEPHRLTLMTGNVSIELEFPRFSLNRPPAEAVWAKDVPVYFFDDFGRFEDQSDVEPAVWVCGSPAFKPGSWLEILASPRVSALVILDFEGHCPHHDEIYGDDVFSGSYKPIFFISDRQVLGAFDGLSPGKVAHMKMSFDLPAGKKIEHPVHNVVGMWPARANPDTPRAFLVTAHYDHVGSGRCDGVARGFLNSDDPKDWIWNGANDNASGVSSLLEIADGIARAGRKFRHSVIFAAFCGEEIGLFGSGCYVDNPPFPLRHTIGQINLEQTGRTDDLYRPSGIRQGTPCMTGFGFSSLTEVLEQAGRDEGIGLYEHPYLSEMLFLSSDNAPFVYRGVPAHTVCLAIHYSDYHGVGDHANKLDYPAMESVTKMILRAVWAVADNPVLPKWSQSEKTQRYREAAKSTDLR